MDSQTLVSQLRAMELWPDNPVVQEEIVEMQQRLPDARALAKELLERDFVTPYQVNQLLTGKGQSLVVGPYRLLERLGEGGSAQVFKARHFRHYRITALKLIHKELAANPRAVQRFLREVEAAARLSHPNVVRAYDAGQIDNGYYFAMEFIAGIDLSRLVKKDGALAIDQACSYILQGAHGLQHIHESSMVHRDIKPSNLMVSSNVDEDNPWGQVKILDLGLARLCEEPQAANQREVLTKLGTVMGTPDFISPEQAMHSSKADIRSDIYSLGCTFYYLLAGQPPFPGGTAVEKMFKHQIDEPEPIDNIRSEVPPAVPIILKKMMAKKPDERYQTPGEVAAALEMLADRRPVMAVPTVTEQPETSETPESIPVASHFADEFAFEERAPSMMAATRESDLRTEQTEWRMWILLACIGTAAFTFLLLLVVMFFGL